MRVIFLLLACLALFSSVQGQDECVAVPQRVDCHPDEGASEENCHARGCAWCEAESGTPWCHLPANTNYGYRMDGDVIELPNGYQVNLLRSTTATYFGDDAERIIATFEFQSNERLRVKITDGTARYEVPLRITPPSTGPTTPLYSVEFTNDPVFSFKVIRRATGTVIFDTSLGGLTFSNQFIQLGIKLPSTNAYGIGENEQYSYRHNFSSFQTLALYARDQSPDGNTNMYGVHPYYTVLENDGNAHSVVIVNSNAQEFQITPAPGYVYRTIGGLLDIYIFLGPTPEDTVRQFTGTIGRQPIPPYWALGFQLCRWGYDNLDNMKAAIQRTRDANIPQDIQYADIDVMDSELDFTIDSVNFPNFNQFIKDLKEDGIKFIPIVDPGIKFNATRSEYPPLALGDEYDVWIKRPDGTPMIGSVWPGRVYFPDFSRESTKSWWTMLFKEYKKLVDFDGIWIDMNEPANWGMGDLERGCEVNSLNNPPYVPGIRNRNLADQTICPDFPQDYGLHYDTHNLYGWSESEATLNAVRETLGKRGVVLTRSTFLGVGKWAAHWLGDNFSRWSNLHASIIGLLSFNLFGIPYNGADICGFGDTAEEEMCTRWQQLGAFYTFSRNHNAIGAPNQDPGVWGELSRNSTRRALEIRYTLLPYLYYLFYLHITRGDTVSRALWHEFPTDTTAQGIDRQFLWGPAFLISPVLDPGQTTVEAYFPDARWYNYYDGNELQTKGNLILDAPLDFINLHVRGGYILPTQEPALNTVASRKNPFGLIVALNGDQTATGGIYYDDGDSIAPEETGNFFSSTLQYSGGILTQTVDVNGYPEIVQIPLGSIRLLGVATSISSVFVNGVAHTDFTNLPSGEVKVNNLRVSVGSAFTIGFS